MFVFLPGAWISDGGEVVAGGALPAFGRGYLSQQKSTPESTTSSTPQTYSTFSIPAGTLDATATYRLGVSWVVSATANNTEIGSDIAVNGTPDGNVLIEPRAGNSSVPLYVVVDVPGIVNILQIDIALRYWRAGGSGEAGVDQVLFELWKVE